MAKFLDKIKHAMTSNKPKSNHPSRGSDSLDYGGEYDSNILSPSGHEQYRTNDYGTRFGSYGIKPRPGTYGSGDYGSNSRLGSHGASTSTGSCYNEYGAVRNGRNCDSAPSGYGYGTPSPVGAYGSNTEMGARRGFGGSDRGPGYQNGGPSSYSLEDRMNSIPAYQPRPRWF